MCCCSQQDGMNLGCTVAALREIKEQNTSNVASVAFSLAKIIRLNYTSYNDYYRRILKAQKRRNVEESVKGLMVDEGCPLFFRAKIVRCAKVLGLLHGFWEPQAFRFRQSQGKDARHERQDSKNYHGNGRVHLA